MKSVVGHIETQKKKKKKKKEANCLEQSWVNPHKNISILFEHNVINCKEAFKRRQGLGLLQ